MKGSTDWRTPVWRHCADPWEGANSCAGGVSALNLCCKACYLPAEMATLSGPQHLRIIPRGSQALALVLGFLLFVGAQVASGAPTTSSLWGTVRCTGPRPELQLLEMRGDSFCAERQRRANYPRQELIVNEQGALANALVFVKEGPIARRPDPARGPVDVAMRDCLFVPRVVAVQCGQAVRLRNDDRTLHTVYLRSKKNNKFIHPFYGPQDPPFEFSLKNPELPVALRCDVQPWMIAYVGVFDHPYFAVTGTEGTFELVDLPPGHYTISVWHEKLGELTEQIELKAGERRALELRYPAPR